ncbi:MAG: hypothetical protein WAT25_14660 [Paracoccaceae bacterium]
MPLDRRPMPKPSACNIAIRLAAEPELTMQVHSRDSSVMTPFGAVITAMANWWRRGEN